MKISTEQAAKIIGATPEYVRLGLQQGRLPIGSAVKHLTRWTYNISPKLLEEYSGVKLRGEQNGDHD